MDEHERMNNNEWMKEGVAKPKEGLTHTPATQTAALIKPRKMDFTNAFPKAAKLLFFFLLFIPLSD